MTPDWSDYELLDFGEGRKLERFGTLILDRPCPAADLKPARPSAWATADARYAGDRAATGTWTPAVDRWPTAENIATVPLAPDRSFRLSIDALPSGQVGIFPEQFFNWQWLAQRGGAAPPPANPLRVLNLFAYTGGSSLAAAAAGAQVTHVDAAKPVVERASFNAEASGLEDSIRWIVEDAMKFCRREVKRGNRYDAVILDPPTYGHGPKGEEWLIKRDLLPLLQLCGELTKRRPNFVLLTCHTPDLGPAELSAYLSDGIFGHCGQPPRTGELYLETADGRRLPSGTYARWPG
jgi:23S rRNA (cytosine1962-C5)-methyltransferase